MKKYPRTLHTEGSRFQDGDHDLEALPFNELLGKYLVIEEKIDGANCGVSFSENGDLLLQSRGHYLTGGPREKQFNLLKQWASCHQNEFFDVLTDRYVMYGEWMYAKHTMFYDMLPHYFMEFDVYDKERDIFLSTEARKSLLKDLPVCSVRVLYEGQIKSIVDLKKFIVQSYFVSSDRDKNLTEAAIEAGIDVSNVFTHTDKSTVMEGLYIKIEQGDETTGRCKFVRESFTNKIIDQDQHWSERPIVKNKLSPLSFERMFDLNAKFK